MTEPSDVYLVSSFAPFRVLCAFARNPTRNLFSRKVRQGLAKAQREDWLNKAWLFP